MASDRSEYFKKYYSTEKGKASRRKASLSHYRRNKERLGNERRGQQYFKIDLKRRYGLTEEQFEELLLSQLGKCAICGDMDKKLSIDHCHTTGQVRGLLCKKCNTGLGQFRDNPEVLTKAAEYLKRNS